MNGVALNYEFIDYDCIAVHIPLNIFIDNIRDFNLIKEYGSMRVSSEIQLLENKEFFTNVIGNSAFLLLGSVFVFGFPEINIVLDPPIQIYG